jgi:hypothetical protein
MDKVLYIIGNGFDLHHELKTSYWNFAEYLRETNSKIYDRLVSYIRLSNDEETLWGKFEENLAKLDAAEVLSDNSDIIPEISSDDYEKDMHVFPSIMSDILSDLTEGLVSEFQDFIRIVQYPPSAFEFSVSWDKQAKFLSFNYTDTLERIYKIEPDHIEYIHNTAHRGDEKIILGHGVDPKNFEEKRPEPPQGLSKEELQDWWDEHDDYDPSYTPGKETLMEYFQASFKPTQEIIKAKSYFFQSLFDVENVFVFGHSLSEVDIPYFQEIVKSVRKDAKWTVSIYSEEEISLHSDALLSLGLNQDQIEFIYLEDIQIKNNQLNINF